MMFMHLSAVPYDCSQDRQVHIQYGYTFLQFSKIFLSFFIMYMYMLVITHISVPFKAVWRQFASLHVFF